MIRETIEQFNRLQELDTRIYEVETLLAGIPEMLREKRMAYEALSDEKKSLEASYNESKTEMLKIEADSEEHKKMLVNAQKKLTSVHNNKEYEAALKELDVLKKSIADADSKMKTLSAATEELQKAIAEKAEACTQSESAYLKEKEEKEGENKELFGELAHLKADRDAFAATMKKSLISKYERVRAARHNLAIVPINGETCTGCYMKIPPQLAVEVKKEKELLQCPYCQRFLYNPKIEAKAS